MPRDNDQHDSQSSPSTTGAGSSPIDPSMLRDGMLRDARLRLATEDRDLQKASVDYATNVSHATSRMLITERIQRHRRAIQGLQALVDALPSKLPHEAEEALFQLVMNSGATF